MSSLTSNISTTTNATEDSQATSIESTPKTETQNNTSISAIRNTNNAWSSSSTTATTLNTTTDTTTTSTTVQYGEQAPSEVQEEDLKLKEEIAKAGFRIGFFEDRNKRYRRTMEDAHSYFYNFNSINGQGWFAVYDGHAGKSAAEYCGNNLHENFKQIINKNSSTLIPEALNETFVHTDTQLIDSKGVRSGCTAVVAYLAVENRVHFEDSNQVVKKRVLYTANVGDARAVLCRNGEAVRLSYDHKGSDPHEARRIVEKGGFVLKNRVNGVLAVTRSLGDAAMKEWVIGNPFTAETVLESTDEFLILACDGIWDVCSDQAACDLVKQFDDPQIAAEELLSHAIEKCSTDNLSVIIIRFENNFVC